MTATDISIPETPKPLAPVPPDEERNTGFYRTLEPVYKLEEKLAKVMRLGMALFSFALAILMAVQVFLRYVAQMPFLGIEEMAPLFAVWAYFLAMAYTVRTRDQIQGGMLVLVVKNPKIIKCVRLLCAVITCAVVFIFTYYAFNMMLYNMQVNRLSSYLNIPRYYWNLALVAGFSLSIFYIVLQVGLEAMDCVAEFRSNRPGVGRG